MMSPVLAAIPLARNAVTFSFCQSGRSARTAMAIYTMDMFTTGNDDDNRAVVRAVPAAELDFAGLAVHGPRNAVDKIFKGASLHP